MREALASAVQQPLHVAACLSGEAMHQADEGGRRLGHKDAADYNSHELYHESSAQMKDQEQQHRATAPADAQAEKHKQASTTSQEAGNSERGISHGLAGNGTGEGCSDNDATKLSVSFEDGATSSVPGMSAVRAAQDKQAGRTFGLAEPRVGDYGIQPPMPPFTLSDSEAHDTTASSSVSHLWSSTCCLMRKGISKRACIRATRLTAVCMAVGWTRHFRQRRPHLQALQGGQRCDTPIGVHLPKGDKGMRSAAQFFVQIRCPVTLCSTTTSF